MQRCQSSSSVLLLLAVLLAHLPHADAAGPTELSEAGAPDWKAAELGHTLMTTGADVTLKGQAREAREAQRALRQLKELLSGAKVPTESEQKRVTLLNTVDQLMQSAAGDSLLNSSSYSTYSEFFDAKEHAEWQRLNKDRQARYEELLQSVRLADWMPLQDKWAADQLMKEMEPLNRNSARVAYATRQVINIGSSSEIATELRNRALVAEKRQLELTIAELRMELRVEREANARLVQERDKYKSAAEKLEEALEALVKKPLAVRSTIPAIRSTASLSTAVLYATVGAKEGDADDLVRKARSLLAEARSLEQANKQAADEKPSAPVIGGLETRGLGQANGVSTEGDGRMSEIGIIQTAIIVLVLVFGLLVLYFEVRMVGNSAIPWDVSTIFKMHSLTLIIVAGVLLVVGGVSERQIAGMMGLLGTVAGYILGREGNPREGTPQPVRQPRAKA